MSADSADVHERPQKVYELLDGANQTVAIYSNREAADAHASDDSSLGVVESELRSTYSRDCAASPAGED